MISATVGSDVTEIPDATHQFDGRPSTPYRGNPYLNARGLTHERNACGSPQYNAHGAHANVLEKTIAGFVYVPLGAYPASGAYLPSELLNLRNAVRSIPTATWDSMQWGETRSGHISGGQIFMHEDGGGLPTDFFYPTASLWRVWEWDYDWRPGQDSIRFAKTLFWIVRMVSVPKTYTIRNSLYYRDAYAWGQPPYVDDEQGIVKSGSDTWGKGFVIPWPEQQFTGAWSDPAPTMEAYGAINYLSVDSWG